MLIAIAVLLQARAPAAGVRPPLELAQPLVDSRGELSQLANEGLASGCPPTPYLIFYGDVGQLVGNRERILSDSAAMPGAPVSVWRELACARWPLFAEPARNRDEPALPAGTPPQAGAILALIRAVTLDPTDSLSLDLLADFALAVAPGAPPADAHSRAAVRGPDLSRYVLLAARVIHQTIESRSPSSQMLLRRCTALMLDVRDFGAAYDCSSRALAQGLDSTWHLLRISWIAFRRGDTTAGTAAFAAAVAAAHSPAARADLGWHFKTQVDMKYLGDPIGDPPHDVLPRTDSRFAWLNVPADRSLPWLAAEASTTQGARWWHPLGSDAAVRDHFARLTFTHTDFRDCISADTTSECPRTRARGATDTALVAHRYRLWDPSTGNPIGVLTYTMSFGRLARTDAAGAARARRDTLQLDLRQCDAAGARVEDTMTAAPPSFVTLEGDSAAASGVVVVPTAPHFTSWGLFGISHDDLHGGDVQQDQHAFGSGHLVLSDLLLSTQLDDVAWTHDATRTMIATRGVFGRATPIHLYYQVNSDADRADLQTSIILYRANEGAAKTAPDLEIAFRSPAVRGVQEVEREIDTGRLIPGVYWLGVRVTDTRGTINATQSVLLTLK